MQAVQMYVQTGEQTDVQTDVKLNAPRYLLIGALISQLQCPKESTVKPALKDTSILQITVYKGQSQYSH